MTISISVDQVFSALADATRRQLLEQLAIHGAASASALASKETISRQAIAKHMQILQQAGLVTRVRKGKEICFQVDPHQLAATARWMQRIAKRWDLSRASVSAHLHHSDSPTPDPRPVGGQSIKAGV